MKEISTEKQFEIYRKLILATAIIEGVHAYASVANQGALVDVCEDALHHLKPLAEEFK